LELTVVDCGSGACCLMCCVVKVASLGAVGYGAGLSELMWCGFEWACDGQVRSRWGGWRCTVLVLRDLCSDASEMEGVELSGGGLTPP